MGLCCCRRSKPYDKISAEVTNKVGKEKSLAPVPLLNSGK